MTILDLSTTDLENLISNWGYPLYRAKQIENWLYQRYVADVAEMTNLPQPLRQKLAAEGALTPLTAQTTLHSSDGQTHKTLFRLPDGQAIETVLMRYDKRQTLCLSTQAGCGMGCPFCATGQMGLQRNLSAGEIVAQVLAYARLLAKEQKPVTNIVLMGMGEPLANYTATWQAIRRLNDSSGFNLGARHITISTVGLVPAMRQLINEPEQVGLAVSLHAPTDALRNQLVPLNRRYPLAMLRPAIQDYITTTHRRVTFEYALMNGLNDSLTQADQLIEWLHGLLCHVNLIPLNPTPDSPWQASPDDKVQAFHVRLTDGGIPATIRLRRGVDIAAGCGQLRNSTN